jgi:hypothetical protein
MAAMLLISPLTWQHVLILTMPFVIWRFFTNHQSESYISIVSLLSVFFLSQPDIDYHRWLVAYFQDQSPQWYLSILVQLPFLGIVLYFITSYRKLKNYVSINTRA